jgi:hypothetical protein
VALDPWAGLSDHNAVPLSRIEEIEDFRTCSFCWDPVDVSAFGDGLVVTVEREGRRSKQELYAHPRCLKGAFFTRECRSIRRPLRSRGKPTVLQGVGSGLLIIALTCRLTVVAPR